MATIKTCNRCGGKGWGPWRPDMGRCFKCDGCGKVRSYTMAERVERFVARCEAHLSELEGMAADVKAAAQRRLESRNARRAKRGQEPIDAASPNWTDRELTQLRETWVSVTRQLKAAKASGKVTAQQQATSEPAATRVVAA